MTNLMRMRYDKDIFISWEFGQKWKEKRETILIPTPDLGNISKYLLDLLVGGDKWVQGLGTCWIDQNKNISRETLYQSKIPNSPFINQ